MTDPSQKKLKYHACLTVALVKLSPVSQGNWGYLLAGIISHVTSNINHICSKKLVQ